MSESKKRPRSGYSDSDEERLQKVKKFITSLKFSVPISKLHEQRERRECPSCKKKRLYYCYDCLTVTHPESHPPSLALPLNVYVLLHSGELRSKSTSIAASTISPDLHIIPYPEVPDGLSSENTLILYPSPDSVEIQDIPHLELYKNVVFVESTWQKSKSVARDERIVKFKHVRIPSHTTLFWRFQYNDPSYLSTAEAIYYFLRTYVSQVKKVSDKRKLGNADTGDLITNYYNGEVDDLLFYYIYQYITVQQRYANQSKFTDRHFDGYILSGLPLKEFLEPPKSVPRTD